MELALAAVHGPAVGAEVSHRLPPDPCVVLESGTVRNPSTAHFSLAHPILLFLVTLFFDRKIWEVCEAGFLTSWLDPLGTRLVRCF